MKRLLRRGFILSLCKGLEAGLGLLFALLMVWKFGAGPQTDALFGAMVLSAGICQMVPTMMSQILIPSLLSADFTVERRRHFLGCVCTVVVFAGATLLLVSLIMPEALLAISAPGLKGEALQDARLYTALLGPVFICTFLFGMLQGVLHSERRFYMTEAGQLLWKAAPVAAIPLAGEHALSAVALAFCAGSLCRLVLAALAFGRHFSEIRPRLPKRSYFPSRTAKLLCTEGVLIGTDWCTELVFRSLASLLPVGGLSIFNYAERFCRNIPTTLLRGVGIVLLPDMAQLTALGDGAERLMLKKALRLAVPAGVAVGLAVFFCATPAVCFFVRYTPLAHESLGDLAMSIRAFSPYTLFLLLIMIYQARLFLLSHIPALLALNLIQGAALVLTWFLTGGTTPQDLALALTAGIMAKTLGAAIFTRYQITRPAP